MRTSPGEKAGNSDTRSRAGKMMEPAILLSNPMPKLMSRQQIIKKIITSEGFAL